MPKAKKSQIYYGILKRENSNYTTFDGLFSRVSRYEKGKTSLNLNEVREDGVSACSDISWTICKLSAPRSRQVTMPTS